MSLEQLSGLEAQTVEALSPQPKSFHLTLSKTEPWKSYYSKSENLYRLISMGQSGVDIDRALVKASETTEKCFLTRGVMQFLDIDHEQCK